jgi:ankyrin repeat protein
MCVDENRINEEVFYFILDTVLGEDYISLAEIALKSKNEIFGDTCGSLKRILKYGPDLQIVNSKGRTVMMEYIKQGDAKSVQVLIDHGALKLKSSVDLLSFSIDHISDNFEIPLLILNHGVSQETRNNALVHALYRNHAQLADRII